MCSSDLYAQYFVKFIRAYEAEGIPIHAITVQNEPGVDRAKEKDPKWFYPSCHWTGEQERDFIRDHRSSSLLKRLASNEEVAAMIAYVCSPAASATSGAALRVDGGVVKSVA